MLNCYKIIAQDITTLEAATKVGEEVRMVGRVINVVYWNGGAENKSCWFINIDQPFPYNPVVVKILQKNYKKFATILKDIRQENMVKIRITGIITLWKPQDREICPTIELTNITQIRILYN